MVRRRSRNRSPAGPVGAREGGHPGAHRGRDPLGHRLVDRLLGIEEAINVRRAHLERLGDVGDGRLLVANVAEERLGGLHDAGADVELPWAERGD